MTVMGVTIEIMKALNAEYPEYHFSIDAEYNTQRQALVFTFSATGPDKNTYTSESYLTLKQVQENRGAPELYLNALRRRIPKEVDNLILSKRLSPDI